MENEQIIRSSIREELPAGVLVADVSDNLRNHYQYTQNIPVYSDFFIVSKTSAVSTIFTVDQRTGKLATNKKIDRDTLCTVDHVCCDVHQNDNGYDAGAQGMSERKQLITFRRTADICQLGFRIVYKLKPSANNNSNMAETTGFCMVIVTILDINDNVPRFILPRPSSVAGLQQWSKHQMQPHTVGSFTAIEIWIDESAPLESCFPLPAAVDEDSTPYGISEYRLEGVTRSELLPLRQKLDHLDGDENSESDIPFTVSSMACKNDRTWDQSAQVIQNHENISPQHLKDASVLRGHSFNSPHLKLLIKLDRERREDYWLKLLALDGSQTIAAPEGFLDPNDLNLMNTVRHTSTLFIHVHVRDVNDNDPQVTPVLDIQVREDIKIGSVIGTVSGTDRDSGENGRLSYRLDLEPVQALSFPLSINPSTGAITVRRALDADRMSSDSQHQLVFKVLTSDFGRPVSRTVTTDVVIHLLDVNDETPQVKVVDLASQSNPPRPTVKENLPPGQLIAFVSATDADAGMNGAMSCRSTNKNFQLEPLSPASSVELNSESNGVPIYMLGDLAQNNNMPNSLEFKLITTTSLDREKSVYEMVEIICTDQALLSSDVRTGRARFLVTVLDDNDNAPTFGSAEIHIQVLENSAPHQLVTVFNASDGDSHPGPEEGSGQWDSRETDQLLRNQYNSGLLSRPDYYQTPKIRYSIDTTGEHYFHIDSSTGALYSRMPFDRESLQEIRFNVTADDGGTPARNTSALVIVTILDKNDNAPVFEKPLYDISLPENISPNSIIANLTAQDLDNGVNADLTYQMEDMQVKCTAEPLDLVHLGIKIVLGSLSEVSHFRAEHFDDVFIYMKDCIELLHTICCALPTQQVNCIRNVWEVFFASLKQSSWMTIHSVDFSRLTIDQLIFAPNNAGVK
ncbi:unnamed protein product [Calicophoron daubneyi]|uniref:Cadherin domain-containing protein n=1 Tax=Calicophoron daubneyi TaxID=300641 RepID=A0AAV2TDG9_CALDB